MEKNFPNEIFSFYRKRFFRVKHYLCIKTNIYSNGKGFIQKVYRLTISLIADGRSTDLINFSGDLSDSELGRLSGIIARFDDSGDYEQEFKDCLKVINEEFEELNNVDAESLAADDFNDLFKRLANKKNNT